jgi:hypothetical protein
MDILRNFKQYFTFTKKEAINVAITCLVLGFVFSFREWGAEAFDFRAGLFSWLNAFLVCLLAVLVHVFVQKTVAVYRGYKSDYALSKIGLVICILFVFYSNGAITLALPGVITLSVIEQFRLGKRWQGLLRKDEALVAFIGPLANIILAILFKGVLNLGLTNQLIQKAVAVNMWMAIFSILPIPGLGGFKIFYHSRTWGLFSIVFIISLSVFLTWYTFWQTVITALVLSALFAIVYFITVEL